LELLLEQWDKSRSIERDEIYRDLSVERKLELLSYLALKKFEQPQYVLFEQAEIEGYIAEFLGIGQRDSRVVLRAIESQHGLLIERSQTVWSFSHLTFQEYLVAKWFCHSNSWSSLAEKVIENYWNEVFLMTFEVSPNLDSLSKLMKINIDKFLENNEKCQLFLKWINRKAISCRTSCKLSATRAFYFHLMTRSHIITHAFDPVLSRLLDINVESFDSMSPDFKFDYSLIYSIEEYHQECHQSNEFTYLIGELFFKIIMKTRNLPYNWSLITEQEQSLRQYYDSNQRLVNCLKNNLKISPETKQYIEEELLLPIAEIEKRKREKAE
jgi:hypothetical protein